MDRGEEKRELSGQQEVKMSLERDGDMRETKQRPTTGEEMKDIHHQYMKRDTMIEEERGENIAEKKTGSGIRMEEERELLKEVGREREVRIKRKKKRRGVLQHFGVISLHLSGHTEVSFSNLQKMITEVRPYEIL